MNEQAVVARLEAKKAKMTGLVKRLVMWRDSLGRTRLMPKASPAEMMVLMKAGWELSAQKKRKLRGIERLL